MRPARCRGEDGIFTLFASLIVVAFLILAGLAVDGGYVLAARRRAIDEANGAARAGAEALAPSAYRTSGAVATGDAAPAHRQRLGGSGARPWPGGHESGRPAGFGLSRVPDARGHSGSWPAWRANFDLLPRLPTSIALRRSFTR
ncbi:MAG: pilus assembly protein TadG-related protein [Acidimicrobiales bacterium]|nr:pilus assembly protein TadG-related protein [Actinomycetota bacterium]